MPHLTPAIMGFLRDLEANNNRDWFQAHREQYLEQVKAPFEALVAAVSAELLKFAPEFATEPSKAIYRIHRDTRFSADKTPYKTHLAGSFFRADLGRHVAAGLYFEVSNRYVGFAGGVYMPDAENLRLIRSHFAEHHERLNRLTGAKRLLAALGELQGDKLRRPPKGYPAEHPAAEWLKFKNMYYWREEPAAMATSPKLLSEVVTRFKLMYPVMAFLNEPLQAAHQRRAPLEAGWI